MSDRFVAAVLVALCCLPTSGCGGNAPTVPSSPAPPATLRSVTHQGVVGYNETQTFILDVPASGALTATLEWTGTVAALGMDLHVPGSVVASSRPTPTGATLTYMAPAGEYRLQVLHRDDGCSPPSPHSAACSVSFTLRVTHP